MAFYYITVAFLDSATVLPRLVALLGGNDVALGLILGIRQAGYFLPQPISAHLLQGKTRFQPFLLQVTFWGRIGLFPAALFLFALGNTAPAVALGVFALAYALFWVGDGLGGVPWTALVGRTIPLEQRGRLFATTQVLGGLSRLLVSGLVAALLAGALVPFPANLALLVLGAAVALAVSWVFLAAIREPEPDAAEVRAAQETEVVSFVRYLAQVPQRFRERPDMARLAMVQILATSAGASIPFLITATGASGAMLGFLQASQTLGFLLLAPLWGMLTDRRGARSAIAGQFGVGLCVPLASLVLLAFDAPMQLASVPFAVMLFAYFCYGSVMETWVTSTNYLLEALPEGEQATYIAIMNAATGPALLLPVIAGLIASRFGPVPLFVVVACLLGAGLFLALSLPETRKIQGGSSSDARTR